MKNSNFSSTHAILLRAYGAIYVLALVATSIFAALAKVNVSELGYLPAEVARILGWSKERAWFFILLFAAVAPFAKFLQERLNQRWIWSTVQSILNKIQEDYFGAIDGDLHHHRATLFKYSNSKWIVYPSRGGIFWPWGARCGPKSGWLFPVLRSGHTTQKSNALFLAPDDADRAEGVAGKTWTTRSEITVTDLVIPELGNPNSIITYAKKTWVRQEYVANQLELGRQLALSFKAFPIEVNNRRWGVLLLDSRSPNPFQKNRVKLQHYAYVFGKLLERG